MFEAENMLLGQKAHIFNPGGHQRLTPWVRSRAPGGAVGFHNLPGHAGAGGTLLSVQDARVIMASVEMKAKGLLQLPPPCQASLSLSVLP